MDLLAFFRAEYAWTKLYRLLSQLPTHSRWKSTIAEDDELADRAAERGETPPPSRTRPSQQGWTPEVDRLTIIADRLAEVRSAVIAGYAQKRSDVPKVEALPRPEDARQRQERRAAWARHENRVRIMMGR